MRTTYEGQNPRPESQTTPPPPPAPSPTPGMVFQFSCCGLVQMREVNTEYLGLLNESKIGDESFLHVITPHPDPQLPATERWLSMRSVLCITRMSGKRMQELIAEKQKHPPSGAWRGG